MIAIYLLLNSCLLIYSNEFVQINSGHVAYSLMQMFYNLNTLKRPKILFDREHPGNEVLIEKSSISTLKVVKTKVHSTLTPPQTSVSSSITSISSSTSSGSTTVRPTSTTPSTTTKTSTSKPTSTISPSTVTTSPSTESTTLSTSTGVPSLITHKKHKDHKKKNKKGKEHNKTPHFEFEPPTRITITVKQRVRATSSTIPAIVKVQSSCLGEWSEWMDRGKCSEECGACGVVQRYRTCKTTDTCPCVGEYKTVKTCNIRPCKYPKPSCCPPFDLAYKESQFFCGPQPDEIVLRELGLT